MKVGLRDAPVGGGEGRRKAAFTLVELLMVVGLLALLASMATLLLGEVSNNAKIRAAESDMRVIRDALIGIGSEPSYLVDMGGIPGFSLAHLRVHNLMNPTNVIGREGLWLDTGKRHDGYADFSTFTRWNPETGRGWRGPYVKITALTKNTNRRMRGLFPNPEDKRFEDDLTFNERGFFPKGYEWFDYPQTNRFVAYGVPREMAISDPWGNPYVLQVPPEAAIRINSSMVVAEKQRFNYARLVSAGPNGRLETPCHTGDPNALLDRNRRNYLKFAGMDKDGNVHDRGDDVVLFLMRSDVYEENE